MNGSVEFTPTIDGGIQRSGHHGTLTGTMNSALQTAEILIRVGVDTVFDGQPWTVVLPFIPAADQAGVCGDALALAVGRFEVAGQVHCNGPLLRVSTAGGWVTGTAPFAWSAGDELRLLVSSRLQVRRVRELL